MVTKGFEDLRVYQLAEELADDIWRLVRQWDSLARDTIGKQLIRSRTASAQILLREVDVELIRTIDDLCEWHEAPCMRLAIGCGEPFDANY